MHRGYFKVWRKQEDSRFWSMGATYRGVWLTLLHKANHKSGWFLGHEIKPGEFACGVEEFGSELEMSRQQMRTCLTHFEEWGMISTSRITSRATKVTICNWDIYNGHQPAEQPSEQPTPNQQPTNTQPQSKNVKNETMEEKHTARVVFVPPTIEEVTAYCAERKNGIDAIQWHSYYSSNGWKVGKVSMKNWRAAVVTWERRRKAEQAKNQGGDPNI